MKRLLLIRLIIESFGFAINSLKVNKLRTFLSLLGITIGIFAIISVFTVIDSLERYIKESLDSLGNNMVYIQKWPWTVEDGETEYPYWKYINRPNPEIEETEMLIRKANNIEDIVFLFGFNRTVQFENNKAENTQILSTAHALFDIWDLEMKRGRYFSEQEMNSGAPVAILGSDIAENLMEGLNPVGRTIKFQGMKFRIIGVYEKKGQDLFGTSMDQRIHISVNKALTMVDIRNRDFGQTICIKAKQNADNDEFLAEIQGILRTIRKLKPMEENDFAINEVSIISDQFDQFFEVFNMAGWIIGGFSIVVGGFGIANIMFVSVKERTKIIGIQKSLGAKRYFILFEFIFEAIVLSVLGGLAGLFLIFIGAEIFSYVANMPITLTPGNIVTGLMISSVIGLIAGFMPALSAARLDPVEAINTA